jgi:hypothetical protein
MGMNTDAVQRLYVAYFNRPADPVSLSVYESLLPTDSVATQAELQALADTYFSPSAEYAALYAGMSNTQIVDQLYQNIFGRSAEVDGLIYWAAELTAGRQTVAGIALQLSYSAQGTDADVVTNRIEAANAFTTGLTTTAEITGYSGDAAAASARTWLATVSSDTASKDTAIAGVDTAIADVVAAANPAADSQTFTLTTGIDTFTGDTGDDAFNADNTGTDTSSTADNLAGGGGTDALNMFSDGAAAALPILDSIETINFYDQDADVTLSGAQQASLTKATFTRGDGDFDATLGANLATLSLSDMDVNAADIAVTFGTARTDVALEFSALTGGTGDDVTITAAAINTLTLTPSSTSTIGTLTLGDAETVNVVANAKMTFVDGITTTDAAATLTITGTGAVDLSAIDTGFTTVNAAGNSGGLTGEIGVGNSMVVTGSSSNDVITANTTDALATTDKLAVDAGGGTADVLVVAETIDINSAADGARYTNFEIVRTADSLNMANIAVDAIQITGGTSESYTGMTAAQGANVTFLGDNTTATTFALATATGTSDAITINLSSATATTNVDVAGLTLAAWESLTLNATTGSNVDGTWADGGTSDVAIAATAATLTSITVTGSQSVGITTGGNITKAVTIDASAATADFLITGALTSGSVVTATDYKDSITVSTTNGTTYNAGTGNDSISVTVAGLVATGADDNKINAGDGTDTITISDAGATTLTDNHFTFVTGAEKLTLSGTGDTSITTGGSFNTAFATSATITSGTVADTSTFTYSGGLYGQDTTVVVNGDAALMNAASESFSIVTGAGDDTVTLNTAAIVGAAGASSGVVVTTGAGADKITIEYGTMLASTGTQVATVTAGTGADTITKTAGTNSTTVTSVTKYVVAAGDSNTDGRDKITGYDVADGTNFGDLIDLPAATVATSVASEDYGVISSHNLSGGFMLFDDAAAYATALVINSSNLGDVLGYLAANVTNNQTVAFLYDSTGDGSNDATMVFMNGATDILIELAGITAATSVNATATTTTANTIIIG